MKNVNLEVDLLDLLFLQLVDLLNLKIKLTLEVPRKKKDRLRKRDQRMRWKKE